MRGLLERNQYGKQATLGMVQYHSIPYSYHSMVPYLPRSNVNVPILGEVANRLQILEDRRNRLVRVIVYFHGQYGMVLDGC